MRLALALVVLLAVAVPAASTSATTTTVGPKKYYLVLGSSGAFGFQPNLDVNHGYSDQWLPDLQSHGVVRQVNFACLAETTVTMISGSCAWRFLKRTYYTGSQLSAAVNFLERHPGQVSPVTLDIGMVDADMAIWPPLSCTVSSKLWDSRMALMDQNLTGVILPQLVHAMTDENGHRTGDLVMLNVKNSLQNDCPDFDHWVVDLNQHLAADAAMFDIPIADIYTPFKSPPNPSDNVCTLTWVCVRNDGHATGGQPGEPGNGYGLVAQVLEQTLGY